MENSLPPEHGEDSIRDVHIVGLEDTSKRVPFAALCYMRAYSSSLYTLFSDKFATLAALQDALAQSRTDPRGIIGIGTISGIGTTGTTNSCPVGGMALHLEIPQSILVVGPIMMRRIFPVHRVEYALQEQNNRVSEFLSQVLDGTSFASYEVRIAPNDQQYSFRTCIKYRNDPFNPEHIDTALLRDSFVCCNAEDVHKRLQEFEYWGSASSVLFITKSQSLDISQPDQMPQDPPCASRTVVIRAYIDYMGPLVRGGPCGSGEILLEYCQSAGNGTHCSTPPELILRQESHIRNLVHQIQQYFQIRIGCIEMVGCTEKETVRLVLHGFSLHCIQRHYAQGVPTPPPNSQHNDQEELHVHTEGEKAFLRDVERMCWERVKRAYEYVHMCLLADRSSATNDNLSNDCSSTACCRSEESRLHTSELREAVYLCPCTIPFHMGSRSGSMTCSRADIHSNSYANPRKLTWESRYRNRRQLLHHVAVDCTRGAIRCVVRDKLNRDYGHFLCIESSGSTSTGARALLWCVHFDLGVNTQHMMEVCRRKSVTSQTLEYHSISCVRHRKVESRKRWDRSSLVRREGISMEELIQQIQNAVGDLILLSQSDSVLNRSSNLTGKVADFLIVLKPECGGGGRDVFLIRSSDLQQSSLGGKLRDALQLQCNEWCVSLFESTIHCEYRVVLLANAVLMITQKKVPYIVADGVRSIHDHLRDYCAQHGCKTCLEQIKNKDISTLHRTDEPGNTRTYCSNELETCPVHDLLIWQSFLQRQGANTVLDVGTHIPLSWKFNLHDGNAIPSTSSIEPSLKKQLVALARRTLHTLGVLYAAVDIIQLNSFFSGVPSERVELKVLEVNGAPAYHELLEHARDLDKQQTQAQWKERHVADMLSHIVKCALHMTSCE